MTTRLDTHLVDIGHYATRARAADAVRRGVVTVDGVTATKVGAKVAAGAVIAIDDPAAGYVSRGALKLIAGLDAFGFDPKGRQALDLGASTGGFTQVLLERGAAHVTAVDVGVGQMDPAVGGDPRVLRVEGVNARDLAADHLPAPLEAVVADLSFISLRLALPPALALAAPGAWLVALVKPQFEAGREALGKGGIVRDPAVHQRVCADVAGLLRQAGWVPTEPVVSPVTGGDGNTEFLIGAEKPA
ncbi:MAG: TlyA family RNA methyltransferase [Rhodobiaceae bacterium]|nr:TlyA family RNA methyltransferase [Rhodobiaceae bacterium]